MEYFSQGNAKITGTGFLCAAEDTEMGSRREQIIQTQKFGMNSGKFNLEIPWWPAKGAQGEQAEGFKEKFPEFWQEYYLWEKFPEMWWMDSSLWKKTWSLCY